MDVSLKKNLPPPTCYRCHKTRHKAPDCPDKYNIRMSSVEELEMEIMVRRDIMKIAWNQRRILYWTMSERHALAVH